MWAEPRSRWWMARPATSCPPATRSRSGVRCLRSRATPPAPAKWARRAAADSASSSPERRWSTAIGARSRRRSAVARPDVLLVSLGTTLGWRVADELLLEQLGRAGASTAAVSVGRGAADRLRRGYPLNDLVEMHAARRTVRTAVERYEPRAVIVSSTTAALLLPALPMPYAIRFDAPARLNRPGARNAFLHALERRAMRRSRITIPFSVAGAEALPNGAARSIVVPAPVDPSPSGGGSVSAGRERLAVAYVPDPKAKG